MYALILFLHSWIRWIILILSVMIIIRSFRGWSKSIEYKISDNRMSVILVALFHTQLILGLLLYLVLSPITETVLTNFGQSMHDPRLRFWGIEHSSIMILAVVMAQLGRSFSKKASASRVKFRLQAIFFLAALILVLSRIPWDESTRLFRGITR